MIAEMGGSVKTVATGQAALITRGSRLSLPTTTI